MTSLIVDGKITRGFLGVVIQDLSPELVSAMNVPANQGVVVSNVSPHSPAGRAGLKSGDVILKFNDKLVTSVSDLRNKVASVKPGETVAVQIVRDGKPFELNAKIEEQPKDMVAAARQGNHGEDDDDSSAGTVLGMTLKPLTPELAKRSGTKSSHGVLITGVDPNGPAANAGLVEGAVLLEVNHHPVKTIRDVQEQVKQTPSKKYVLLLVEMGDADRYVAVPNA
jgi:serine protease Do